MKYDVYILVDHERKTIKPVFLYKHTIGKFTTNYVIPLLPIPRFLWESPRKRMDGSRNTFLTN